jgi:hypothetical protein
MRFTDWKSRLVGYLAVAARTPFAEGRHDCALFLAGGVEAMTGVDPAAAWRGRNTTTRGGLRMLRKASFADHIAAVAATLPEIAPAFAAVGDAAVVADPQMSDVFALGIVQGEMIYVLRPGGLGLMPMTSALRAFRV